MMIETVLQKNMRENSYHLMKFPQYFLVIELMAHWQKFRAIPDETKKLFRYIKDVGRGYENKIQEEVIDG
ncbi:MAG: hypothetical protein ACJAV6_000382, partial [Candidatus Paceibacteria bacterium]